MYLYKALQAGTTAVSHDRLLLALCRRPTKLRGVIPWQEVTSTQPRDCWLRGTTATLSPASVKVLQ